MAAQPEDEEKLRDLLQHMLTPIRRARATPLQFEIDSTGIARDAFAEFLAGLPEEEFEERDGWKSLTGALDALVAATLGAGSDLPSPEPIDSPTAEFSADQTLHPLAAWLDRFFNVMRAVDHRAFEILGLRIEGMQDRDIAGQLDLGLRLVGRIVQELRASWANQTVKA